MFLCLRRERVCEREGERVRNQGDKVQGQVEGEEEKVAIGKEDLSEELVVQGPAVLLRRHLLNGRATITCARSVSVCRSVLAWLGFLSFWQAGWALFGSSSLLLLPLASAAIASPLFCSQLLCCPSAFLPRHR